MRVIKFRAFSKRSNMPIMMHSGSDLGGFFDHVIYPTTDFHVMQFTGLQGKNGVDIYEGDIVKVDNFEAPVIYSGRWCEFKVVAANSLGFYPDIEVIGNIHEDKLKR